MKPSRISTLLHTLCGTFRRCASRFPMAVAFTAALTAYLLYLVATEMNNENERLLVTLGYYFSVGTVLSLSLHLWGEEMKRRTALAVHVVAQVLLAADTIFLYHSIEESSIVGIAIAHVAGVLAIGLSVFFLSFLHERDDIAVGNFAQQTVAAFVLTVAIGMVMSGGLCLPLDTLRNYERGNSPTPPVLRTRQGNVFVLTSSKSTYGIKEDNDSTAGTYPYLKVEGLLYHNTKVISAKYN